MSSSLSSYRVDRGRHLAALTFAGVLYVVLSLPNFRLERSRFLSLGSVAAEESGAANLLDLLGPPGRCSGC